MYPEPQILIADDDTGFLRALTVRLQREGYRVLVAPDGYQALAFAVKHTPDLLILDIRMPAGDGFTVQDRKDRLPELVDVPVIYITGDKSKETQLRAEEAGATVVHKPFDMDELLEVIRRELTIRVV
jgi:DNA-binding response OmpR family regulator